VHIVGPVAADPSWQAREGTGFDKAQFLVDWDQQVVTCPMGQQSISWHPHTYPQSGMRWEARFARKDCTSCPHRAQCTRAKKEPRIVGLQAREQLSLSRLIYTCIQGLAKRALWHKRWKLRCLLAPEARQA